MPFVPMKQILDEALKGGYGVGAYNVNNMEQMQAIAAAARDTQSPLIVQASKGALEYTSFTYLKHLIQAAVEESPGIPVAMHLDHGPDLDTVKKAIDLGFTSVMIDGSLDYSKKTDKGSHPARSFEDNVAVTKEVVDYAHSFGVSVEGELGTLGGIEDDTVADRAILTDPGQVEEFVARTGVDALAIAIGTSHGAYKFKAAPVLALDLVSEIHARVPKTALVMHGSSSVPPELVDRVNQFGGQMKKTAGVPMESIQEAIRRGIAKVNIDTDGRLVITGAIRQVFAEKPAEFDPRKYLGPARKMLTEFLCSKMRDLGTAGHAGDYEPLALEDLRAIYAAP